MPNLRKNRLCSHTATPSIACGVGALLMLLAGAPASAQTALGDGRALDANLQQGRGGVNPMGRDIVSELRLRNAIVTGNVPGGFGFRGELDYRAPGDFRAELGSDDIFAFQRDSLLSSSGLGGHQLRGTDALRYQMQLSIGGQIDAFRGIPIVRRPGDGASPADLLADAAGYQGDFSNLRFDPFTLRPGALRSTSDYLAGQVLTPRILGQGRLEEDGPTLFSVATPLRGVTLDEAPDYVRPLMPRDDSRHIGAPSDQPDDRGAMRPRQALPDRDAAAPDGEFARPDARIERDPVTGRITDGRDEPGAVTGRVESQRLDHRSVIEELRRAHRSLLATPEDDADDAAPRPPMDPTEEIIDRWAPEFGGDREPDAFDLDRPDDADRPDADARRPGGVVALPELESAPDFDRRVREMASKLQLPSGAAADMGRERADGFDPARSLDRGELIREAEDLLGRVMPRVENLAPAAGPERNLFAEHMRAGERALASGRWFDAEERFTSALRMSPGNAMAAVGRVNAQIGAGMYRSAAINLQQLLRTNPELIGVRYDASLLPGAERLQQVREQLRRVVFRNDDMGRSGAVILGYLGHQFDYPADVREAFHAVDRITKELGDQPDPLYDVLRAVWLRGQRPAPAPEK